MAYERLKVDQQGRFDDPISCVDCGCDLRGKPVSAFCPECQAPLSDSLIGRAMCEVDDEGRIETDIDCIECQYNLRGLDPESACPECGTPIGYTLEYNRLHFSDPQWLQKVANGLLWYIVATLGGLAIMIGVGILSIFINDPLTRTLLMTSTGLIVGLVSVFAVFTFTAAKSTQAMTFDPMAGLRFWTRLMIIGQVLTSLTGGCIMLVFPNSTAAGMLVQLLMGVVGIITFITIFSYIRYLALQTPDDKLPRSVRTIIIWYGILATVGLIGGVLTVFSGMSQPPPPGQTPQTPSGSALALVIVGGIGGCIGGLGSIIFWIWSVVVLFKVRSHYAKAALLAMRNQPDEGFGV